MKLVLQHEINEGNIILKMPSEPFKSKLISFLEDVKKKYNGYINLDFQKPYKKRTTGKGSQNSKYWAMCSEYGLFVGMTKEEVSDGIKERAVEERGYPVDINRISKKRVPRSMTKINTVEQSILIEMLYQEAAENGYVFDEYKIEEKSETFQNTNFEESKYFKHEESNELAKEAFDIW